MRLSHLFVFVADLDRTRRFYVDALGLEAVVDEGEYLRVGGEGGFFIGFEVGRRPAPATRPFAAGASSDRRSLTP